MIQQEMMSISLLVGLSILTLIVKILDVNLPAFCDVGASVLYQLMSNLTKLKIMMFLNFIRNIWRDKELQSRLRQLGTLETPLI